MKVFFAPHYQDNPYQDQLMIALKKLGIDVETAYSGARGFFQTPQIKSAEVIHFHWLDPFFLHDSKFRCRLSMEYFFFKIRSFRKGRKIVWTVHNLHNHNKKNLEIDQEFVRRFIKLVDGFSVHNKYTRDLLVSKYNVDAKKIAIIKHANFIDSYPNSRQKNLLKERFALHHDERIYMMLGNILPYKGVLDLIEAFKELKLPNAKLLICGKVKKHEDYEILNDSIGLNQSIILYPHYVPDEELGDFFTAADVMIYPYKDIVTSGALLLGMSYKKCCLASHVGSMEEYLERDFLFSGQAELKSKLIQLHEFSTEKIKDAGESNYQKIKNDDWHYMAKATKELYINA